MAYSKKSESETLTGMLEKVAVMYANVHAVNPVSDKYQVIATNLTDEQVKYLQSFDKEGIGFWKEPEFSPANPEWGMHLKFRSNYPPKHLVDGDNKPLPTDVLVGNNSICNILFSAKGIPGGPSKEVHVKFYLNGLQVVDLVPYTPEEGGAGFKPVKAE